MYNCKNLQNAKIKVKLKSNEIEKNKTVINVDIAS